MKQQVRCTGKCTRKCTSNFPGMCTNCSNLWCVLLCVLKKKATYILFVSGSFSAPPAERFSNQLFDDFKKLFELKPFINTAGFNSPMQQMKQTPVTPIR